MSNFVTGELLRVILVNPLFQILLHGIINKPKNITYTLSDNGVVIHDLSRENKVQD